MVSLVALGLKGGAPGITHGQCATQESDWVGQIRNASYLMVLRGQFPSLPMKKTAKANLVISVVFLVALGL